MILRFTNWDKYNKRQKDIKRPYWFALSNEIFTDSFYAELTDQERQAFLWLLCEASKQNKYGELEVSVKLFSRVTGYKSAVLDSVIDKLLKSGRAAGSRQDGGRIATATRQDNTIQNINTTAPSKLVADGYPSDLLPVASVLVEKHVLPELAVKWQELYGAAYVVREIQSALAWELANPKKVKKNFSRFMSGWLSRGWRENKKQASTTLEVSGVKIINLA